MRKHNDYEMKQFNKIDWRTDTNENCSIIVSFAFNGESIIFTHLKYLFPYVDLFLISEAKQTFSGLQKTEFFIDIFGDRLAPYNSKIKYLIIESFPPMPQDMPFIVDHRYMNNRSIYDINSPQYLSKLGSTYYETWYREEYQRGIAAEYLTSSFFSSSQSNPVQLSSKYLLFVVDVDEIVKREVIAELRQHYYSALSEPVYLDMDMYYYSFRWKKNQRWQQPFVVRDTFLLNPNNTQSLHAIRTTEYNRTSIMNSGWHCSYCSADLADIVRKIESFSHIEYNKEEFKDKDSLASKIRQGMDIFDRSTDTEILLLVQSGEGDQNLSSLPPELQEFQEYLIDNWSDVPLKLE
jgi:beta-1,4-mannosyl-glycoprotein beta-1,4-N-acetylglucosaminyltransferase